MNPWKSLSRSAPFVLKSDAPVVQQLGLKAKGVHRLHLNLLPIPFLGNPDAPVVLLNLNPGYHPKDDKLQATPYFEAACRKCLTHSKSKYPFIFLDPAIEGEKQGPGWRWWNHKLRALLQHFDGDARFIANQVFCIEYFPYRSKNYKHSREVLASQSYGFSLLRAALKRKALVLIMRSERLWEEAVPELKHHKNKFKLRNPRNPMISAANCPDGFPAMIAALKKHR